MALLFISSFVPDRPEYWNPAFGRSGNNVSLGLADAFPDGTALVSCRPTPSYPNGKLFFPAEDVKLEGGKSIHFVKTLNLKFVKNLIWGFECQRYISQWAKDHQGEDNSILVYNVDCPPISQLYRVCKKTHTKLFCMMYDMGMPPKRFGLGFFTRLGYAFFEKIAKKYFPLIEGRIIINEKMIDEYAPNKDYILVDGGINNQVINNLFPLRVNQEESFVFVCAGKLWDQNGTKLILEAFKKHPELKATIVFAGKGLDVPLIEDACKRDSRIKYVGMLTTEELFKLYETSDVLLNLRIEEEVDFHFPGKVQEYLVTGKHIISTPIAHAERDYGEYMTFLHDITPDGLAELMGQVMKRGKFDLYETGVKAREFMLKNRTWTARAAEIMDYINSKTV